MFFFISVMNAPTGVKLAVAPTPNVKASRIPRLGMIGRFTNLFRSSDPQPGFE